MWISRPNPRELNFRPKIVATLDGSPAEIAKNSRIKFRYLKKRREISHLIISSEPIYEAEARIFIVQSADKIPEVVARRGKKNSYVAIALVALALCASRPRLTGRSRIVEKARQIYIYIYIPPCRKSFSRISIYLLTRPRWRR